MSRLLTFVVIVVVVGLWAMTSSYGQRNPEPYEKPKKKSTAKTDTATAEAAKADTAKTDTAKTTRTKTDTSKAAETKPKPDKANGKKTAENKTAEKTSQASDGKKSGSRSAEPTVAKQTESQPPVSKAAKPVATKPQGDAKHVRRAVFTHSIVNREPVDKVETLTTQSDSIFFFTEVVDMTGKVVTHQWIYADSVVAEVSFNIGGPRWRVYSRKRLRPAWVGRWTVAVVDEKGKKLHEDSFAYVAAAR